MSIVRQLMNAEPFMPFVIKTSDGKEYRVKHPDYIAISPRGGWITAYSDEDNFAMISALHVVAAEPKLARQRMR